ncbi:MAG: hypothetical protein AABZ31_12370 [Bdellovibrionota bacterium]
MDAFTFLLKTAVFTALLIYGMQYKFDEKTVETHFIEFVQGSSTTEPIHKVAEGARQVGTDGWSKFREFIGSTGSTTSKKAKSESQTTRKASSFKWQGDE